MKKSLIALTAALMLCTTGAMAAPAKKAPAKKPAATKKAAKPAPKTAPKSKAKPAPAKVTVLPPQELPEAVAGEAGEFPVIVGALKCDEGQLVIRPEGTNFKLQLPNNREYTLRRVKTTSGVVRLEDETGNSMWLQMGNKSMLIDRKAGGRVADGCRNADQERREEEEKTNPTKLL